MNIRIRKLVMLAISAALTYFGLTQAGWNGSEPPTVGGISIGDFSPEAMKKLLTAIAPVLVLVLDYFQPGLGARLSQLLDKFLKFMSTPPDGSTDLSVPNKPTDLSVKKDPFRDDMDAFRMLNDRHGVSEANQQVLEDLLKMISKYYVRREGTTVEKLT